MLEDLVAAYDGMVFRGNFSKVGGGNSHTEFPKCLTCLVVELSHVKS
ncbi:hypothetical protein ORI20_31180 [Mycobacterium sp. CVI_P3]|uniref:Uncharacterized protein n=1 Tax=Mycobacterium pinniadriaticum TaxID=2994102 RepID=A0ABT3SPR3_9MYCO|nr:hypothetical protein [Mycobacterium pinniadriaticum]MCX2934732.1 hypothetical protein [Mycobacterium pinniadriaticum]MCX2941154.1 hypothetical protein [Mycobacterium pinniadriaticum]